MAHSRRSRKSLSSAITRFPSPIVPAAQQLSEKAKIALIAKKFREIMHALGLDLSHESLADTPERVAHMYVMEIFSGLNLKNFPKITSFEAPLPGDQSDMILVKDIVLTSFCEHHFLPMFGKAHVAYIPQKKIIGLSKINRLVKYFCRRPQLQERLTAQIADSLSSLLETPHVAVVTEAAHLCVETRGVEDQHSSTIAHLFLGKFRQDATLRKAFLQKTIE